VKFDSNLPPLSIVVPCFNEARNIEGAINEIQECLDRTSLEGEIIVVNDGSTDDTLAVVKKIKLVDRRVLILNKEKNEGMGRGFWDGVIIARNPFVVLVPGDGENDVSEILSFYFLAQHVDIVVPYIHNADVRHFGRRVVSSLYRFIINLSFGTSLNYTNGTVIYNRDALSTVKLSSSGFFYQTELLVKLIRKGFLYAEVPHSLSERKGGRSTALTFRSLCSLIRSFLVLLFEIHIRRVEGARRKFDKFPTGTVTHRKLNT